MDWAGLMKKFKNVRVLVVGDICLDRWCSYDPDEADVSRETGIPRLSIVKMAVTPGAGGTVANNLAALGAGRVSVLGAIGQDGFGFELEQALSKRAIDYHLLVATPDIQTFTYSKMINLETGIEDRPRVDFINTKPLPSEVEDQLIANFHLAYQGYDAIVVADQAETDEGGVVTPAFREVIAEVAQRHPTMTVVADSRRRIGSFRNVLATPNAEEAKRASEQLNGTVDFDRLRKAIGSKPLVVTDGEAGATVYSAAGSRKVPGVPVGDPVDTCGAGDAFAAGLALALQAGADIDAATRFATMVASVTVMKPGTGEATQSEVLAVADSVAI